MNKKILIILFMMLFITGCSVNYNLEIFGNQIAEKITIKPNGNINVDIDEIASVKQYSYTDLQKKEYYDFEKVKNKNGINLQYEYTYPINDFKYSRILNECYSAYNIINNENEIKISTSKDFNCFVYNEEPVNNVKINIKTDHLVIESNAHTVNDGVYTWNLSDDNDDNSINITISSKAKDMFLENAYNGMIQILIILGMIGGIAIIILIYVGIKNKKVNKI